MSTTLIKNRKNGVDIERCTNMERMFVLQMLASESCNSTEAARAAKYKHPTQAAHQLLKRPHIRALLGKYQRQREERTQLTSDKIWEYIHRVIFFDPAECYPSAGPGWWIVKSIHEMPLGHRQMIEGIDVKTIKIKGEDVPIVTVKFVSKGRALETAARHALPQEVNMKAAVATVSWDELLARGNGRVNPIDERLAREEKT